MFTATEAKYQGSTTPTVETEIALINLNILGAVGSTTTVDVKNTTETMVSNATVTGTPMTSSNVYYAAWQNTVTNNFAVIEMNKVLDYYKKLGYTVNRKSDDGEYLYWTINW